MINGEYLNYKNLNSSTLYLIFSPNHTLYLGIDGLTFSDIIYSSKLDYKKKLALTFDADYSDAIYLN